MISTFIFSTRLKAKLFFIIFFSTLQLYTKADVIATPTPGVVCSGQSSVIKVTGQIGTNIRWQRDSSGTFVFIPNETTDELQTPALTSEAKYRAVVSTLNILLFDTSTVATVSIAPFSAGGTIVVSDADICGGETIIATLNNDHVGNLIQWQLDTTNVFEDIPGAITSPYSSPPLFKSTTYRAMVTSSPCPAAYSNTAAVTVTPASVAGIAKADTTVVCKGSGTNLNVSKYTGTTFIWQIDTTGAFVDISGASGTSYATPPLTRTTKYRVGVTNGNCTQVFSNTIEISIAPSSEGGEASPDTTICEGNSITLNLKGNQGSIQWQIDTSGAFVNIPGAVSKPYSTQPITKTTRFRAMVTSGNCPPDFSTITVVTVNAKTDPGIASANTTTICSGGSTQLQLAGSSPGSQIQWQSKTTGPFVNIPGATGTTYTTGFLTTTTSYQALVEKHGCVAVSNTVTLTVNPNPNPGLTKADTTLLCGNGTTQVHLTGTTPGASIQWQSKTTGAYADVPGATNATHPTGNLTTTTSYQAVVMLNTCTATSNEVTVTVNPIPAPGTATAVLSTLCSGNGTTINLASNTAGSTIQWQSKTTGGYTTIPGATNAALPTGNLNTTTTFQAIVTLNGCSAYSNEVTITVNPGVDPGTATAVLSTLCSGNGTTINLASNTAGSTIQWQSKTTGAYATIPGATNAALPTGNLTTTTTYQAVVTLNGCTANSNEVTITVNPIPAPGTATAVLSTLCSGNGTTINLASNTAGSTIQWQNKTTGAYATIPGATNAALPTGNLTTATTFQAIVTLNGCSANSNEVTITVNPIPAPGTATAVLSTLCSGNGTTINLASNTAGSTIQWQSKTTGAYVIIPGATNAALPTGNLNTTTTFQAIVTLNGCSAYSNEVTITVNPGVDPGTATAVLSTLCSGNGTTINLASNTAGSTIQWQSKTTGAYATIPGATNAALPTGNLTTTTTYQAVVTLNGCTANSNEVTITVNPIPAPGTATAVLSTLCSGNGTTINLASNTAGSTIQWQSKTTGAYVIIPGATNAALPTGNLNTTTTFQAIVTLNGCSAYSNEVTITVNPGVDPGTATAVLSTLCSGNGTTINLASNTAGSTIQWQSKTTGAYTTIPGATNAALPTGNLTTTTTFQAIVTLNGCSTNSNEVTITVNPIPAPGTATAVLSTLCSGNGTTINLASNTAGSTIQWQSKTTGAYVIIPGVTSTALPTGNLTATTTFQAVVTLNGCTANSNEVTVTVTPSSTPGTAAAGSTLLCEGDATVITLTGSVGAIQWQSKTTGAFADIAGANSATYNTPALTVTTTYQAVVGSSGCTSFSNPVEIKVNPKPVGGNITPANSSICTNTSTQLTLNNYVGAIQWQSKTTGAFADIAGETDPIYETTNLTVTTTYQAVLKSTGCADAVSTPSVITVAPSSIGGSATATPSSVCKGQSTTIKLTGSVGAIQWQRKTTGSYSDITGETDTVYTTPNLTTTTTYHARVKSGNCPAVFSTEAVVTIAPSSVGGTATADAPTICGGTATTIRLTGHSGTIQWQSNASGSFAVIPGATNNFYNTPTLTQTTKYRAAVQSNNCPIDFSNEVTVSIAPASVGGQVSALSTEVCSGASAQLTLSAYDGTIQWQKNEGTGWTNIAGATGTNLTSDPLTVETDFRAVVTKGSCASANSTSITISITPALKGGDAKAANNSVCSGTSTIITLTGHTGSTYQWQKNDGSGWVDIVGAKDAPYTTPNLTTPTRYHAIVSSGTCSAATSTEAEVTIISASNGGTATAAKPNICSGTNTTITLAGYNGSIIWQVDVNGVFTDIPGANGTSYTTPNLTITTKYRAKVTSNNCTPKFSTEATVTVDPPSVSGTITTSATTVCKGSTVTLTLNGSSGTIQWQTDTTSGTYVDIPSATGAVYSTFALTKESNFRAVVKKGNCPVAITDKVTISIAPALSGGTATAQPSTVCKGTSTTIYLKDHTGSVQWQTNASGTFVNIPSANDTLYITPNLTVSTIYRAIVSSGNCATATSTEAVVAIIPASESGTITADKTTICSGTSAILTLAGHTGSIQWQSDATGTFVDISGATSTVYTTPALTANTNYRAIVTSTGCASVTSAPVLIMITPASQGGTATAVQSSICSGGTATINLTGELGTEIQWQSDASGSYVDIPGATGKSYTTPALTSPTHYRARVRNGTCSMSNSTVVLISITPALQGGTAKATPSTICKGTNTTITLSGHTGSQIQWQTNASGSYKDITGATDSLYLTPNLSVPTNYRARINGSGCAQVISATATVSIIPQSVGGTSSANPGAICSGEKSTISLTGSVGTIQWQTDESGVFVDIPGATGTNYTTPVLTASTSYRAILTSNNCTPDKSSTTLVTVTPASNGGFAKASATTICNGGTTTLTLTGYTGFIQWQTDASGSFVDIPGATGISYTTPALSSNTNYRANVTNANCGSAQSNTVEITITPTLKGGIATPVASTICKGTFTTINLTQYSGSIQWQSNASGAFKDIAGANGSSYTTPALSVNTTYRAVVSSGTCTPATSTETTIVIIPSSVGGTASSNVSTVCSGESATLTLKNNVGSIQWQTNESGTFVNIPNATGTTYVTPSLTTATSYRAIVTSTGCSSSTSTEVLISVAPGSKGGIATASALKVCSGGTTTLTLNGYTGAIQWQTDASGTFADIAGATGTSYTTLPLSIPTNYRAVVTNGNCPSAISTLVSITITPALSGGNAVASPSTICKGAKTTIILSNHSGAVQWQSNASGSFMDITGATDTFYVTPALTVPVNYQAVVSSGGCAPATSTIASVTLTPASSGGAAVAAAPKICSGETTTINLTGYAGTIQWQTNSSGTFTNIFGATGNSYTTPGLTKVTAYRAIVINGGCEPDTSTIATVDLFPASVGGTPTATATTICKGGTTTITLTNYTGTIQWQTNASGAFANIPGATGVSYSTPILTTATQYKATVTSSHCPSVLSSVITINVTDALEGGYSSASPATVCDSSSTSINLSSYKGLIQWQRDSLGTFVDIQGATATPYITPPLKVNTIYRAKLSSGSCPTVFSTPVTAYVTPNLYPGIITAYPNTICSGGNTKLIIKGHTGNVQWQKDSLGTFVNIPGQTKDTCIILSLLQTTAFRAKVSSGTCTPVYPNADTINVNVVLTPTGDTIQQFCSITNPTVIDLRVKDMAIDTVKWYANPSGGTALMGSTPLVNGAFYYATRAAYGCESYIRFKVKVTVYKSANVTLQPANVATCPGLNTFFSVKGDGTGLTYKWMVDESGTGTNYRYISDNLTYKGSNTDTLNVFNVVNSMNGYSFKCVIKGTCSPIDSALSSGAALIINANTNITQQPVSTAMCYGDAAIFNITASGSTLLYQWQIDSSGVFIDLKNDSTYLNTNTASMKIKAFAASMSDYKFRCVIKSAVCGTTINSQEVALSFDEECNVYPVSIPTGFSPNDDGVNDKLVIEGLENYPGSVVRIYNVWGDLVYEKTDYQNDWEGRANVKRIVGEGKLPAGTYYMYVDLKKGKKTKASFLIIKY